MNLRPLATGLLLTILPAVSGADVLVLQNGDRITGEIKRIWDDEITIDPEYASEFKVDLTMVDSIESDREFEIDLTNGTRLVARFSGSDSDGNQIVVTPVDTLRLPLTDVLELDEPAEYYDWETHIDLSSTIKKGNTESSNSRFRADGMFKHGDHRHRGALTFFREEQNDITLHKQGRFAYNYNWLFGGAWFLTAGLNYERDPIINLDARVILSAGIGHDIWNTPRRTLAVQLSAGYQNEDIGGVSEDSSVAVWDLLFRQDFIGDDLELFHNHTIRANLSGRTNTSYRTNTGLKYKVTDLLHTSASLIYDYETQPLDSAANEDLTLLLGLGLDFD